MSYQDTGIHFKQARLAIFRLKDCCARIQEDMEGYYATAALEKVPQIDFIFNWLRKRQVQICLISDFNLSDTTTMLNRLQWSPIDENSPVDAVILRGDRKQTELIIQAYQIFGLRDASQVILLADQPELLHASYQLQCLLTIGLNYGQASARELSRAPYHQLLDSIIELPNYLMRQLGFPSASPAAGMKRERGGLRFF